MSVSYQIIHLDLGQSWVTLSEFEMFVDLIMCVVALKRDPEMPGAVCIERQRPLL